MDGRQTGRGCCDRMCKETNLKNKELGRIGRLRNMNEYSEECLLTFLEKQSQLFDEPVAETLEEAEAFLEDCMAAVVDSLEEVREYFEENGIDVDSMSEEELEEASEVFALPNGQYLIVEG